MSDHFDTERTPVDVTYRGDKRSYFIRELGYYEFQEINRKAVADFPDDKELRGLQILDTVALEAIENEDRTAAFDLAAWRRLPIGPAKQLTHAAMLAQGIDLEKVSEAGQDDAGEDDEGNV